VTDANARVVPLPAVRASPALDRGPFDRRIAAGEGHACVVPGDGSVWCWGRDSALAPADARVARVPHVAGARAVVAAGSTTCATTREGVVCWGENVHGIVSMPPTLDYRSEPWLVRMQSGEPARSVALGVSGACALAGAVECWGDVGSPLAPHTATRFGVVLLADQKTNSLTGSLFTYPTRVLDLEGAIEIAVGGDHVCALTEDGIVRCRGTDREGELGRGWTHRAQRTAGDELLPAAPVPGLRDVAEIAAGIAATCARTAAGEVFCWGSNDEGLVGAPGLDSSPRPLRVEGLPRAARLSVGAMHACVVAADARVFCWGANGAGQLGDGTTDASATPVAMRGIDHAVDVAAGDFGPESFTCVLRDDGRVLCVGSNVHGELGASGVDRAFSPIVVAGLPAVR